MGLKVDNELKFNLHIKGIIKKVAHKIYLLAKLRKCLTLKAAQDVYKAIIRPLMDVGDEFYDCAPKTYLKKLQILQNRAIRITYRLGPRESTTPYHGKTNLQKQADRRLLHTLRLIDWLVSQPEHRDTRELTTRSHDKTRRPLKLLRHQKKLYRRSFVYKGGIIWNALPTYIHNCKQPDKLKTSLLDFINNGKTGGDAVG